MIIFIVVSQISVYFDLKASSQVFQPVRVASTLMSANVATLHSSYHAPVITSRPSGILACLR